MTWSRNRAFCSASHYQPEKLLELKFEKHAYVHVTAWEKKNSWTVAHECVDQGMDEDEAQIMQIRFNPNPILVARVTDVSYWPFD